jgi:hypothetical protein
MNKYLIVVTLCVLSSACSKPASLIPLSPICESYFKAADDYVDKLEATGRFSSDNIACFRNIYAVRKNAHQNPAMRARAIEVPGQETIDKGCRAALSGTQILIKKAEIIPNLSQEEFDADWGQMATQLRCK